MKEFNKDQREKTQNWPQKPSQAPRTDKPLQSPQHPVNPNKKHGGCGSC